MNNRMHMDRGYNCERLIATFGTAELIKVNGSMTLRGGTTSDRAEALEWISLFLPEEFATVEAVPA